MSIYTTRDLQRIEAVDRHSASAGTRLNLLNAIAEATAAICGTKIAMVNLVDAEWVHTVGALGVEPADLRRNEVFCGTLVDNASPTLIVEDASYDSRFWHLEVVMDSGIRFYAGAQLASIEGNVIGALCVLDTDARVFSMSSRAVLCTLAKLATNVLDPDRRPAPTTLEGRMLRADSLDRMSLLRLIEEWAVHPNRRDTFGSERLERLFALTRDH